MTGLWNLIKRNCKLFFKDKGMLLTSLITPIILLVLYITFLASIYHDSFVGALSEFGATIDGSIIDATVAGQLISSLLAVSCVTVSFCCNMIMVQDKVTGVRRDFTVSPVKRSVMALSYYISTLVSTLIVCLITSGACFIYLANIGWYMSFSDVMLFLLDVFLLVMFGTALSSIINVFLTSQGQVSAVGTVVSAGYGFICGAYMPISNFSDGLQKSLSFLPGTYGTALIRNHAMRGAFEKMADAGFPYDIVESIKDSVDCNLYFFGNKIGIGGMYAILVSSVVLLVGVYVLINVLHKEG